MSEATILGKGPSASSFVKTGGLVVGLNHAAYSTQVDLGCCADQIMLAYYIKAGFKKPVIFGRGTTHRCPFEIIRMKHMYGSSAGLALHYLAGLGYKTVNLVGFDAYEDYLDDIVTDVTHKYRNVNRSIDRALFDTKIKPIYQRAKSILLYTERKINLKPVPKENSMRTRERQGSIWLLDATPKNIKAMSENYDGGPRIWTPKPKPTVAPSDIVDDTPSQSFQP